MGNFLPKKITIIGSGYVGLTTGICFAEIGHKVICIDSDKEKIAKLKSGKIPIYEPGLDELMKKNKDRLEFSNDLVYGIKESEIIFIAVGTPSNPDGSADLSYVENVARSIATHMQEYKLIVEKSTVPVQTAEWIKITIDRYKHKEVEFDVASNPEFLREGSAVKDFLFPDRIVIGVESERAKRLMLEIYEPIKSEKLVVDTKSAELIKHASNSFLALKISFINAVANICEKTGADVEKVALGMGLDKRIGKHFLNAGIGYGGSCFPKDVKAFVWIAQQVGYEFALLKEVEKINLKQRELFVKKIEETLWIIKDKNIGILGLSFKPDTDDIRDAPSIDIIKSLKTKGAKIKVYDPKAMDNMKKIFPDITYCSDIETVAKDSDCLVFLTEWGEFKNVDLPKIKTLMTQPIIIDGRNIFDLEKMKELGFIYKSVGRGSK
jgi:UDPglucose 6-dehydrogenase